MKLDHIVYFTTENPESIVAAQQKAGRHAVRGGRHEMWGTQNALLYTANAYIEWLSVEDKNIATKSQHWLTRLLLHDLEQGEGWGTLCFSVDNPEQFERDINQKGFATQGVIMAQRKTPRGIIKKWKMLFTDQQISDQLPFPFFIEWEENEDLRYETLRKEGAILPSNEVTVIKECIFNTEDPVSTAKQWSSLLDKELYSANSIIISNVLLKFLPAETGTMQRLSTINYGIVK